MSSGKNKESLMVFLASHWSTYLSSQLKSLSSFYVTSRNKCICLTPDSCESNQIFRNDVLELESDHEEADTRLLLHSEHAAQAYDRIIIKTPDTDVLVICTAKQRSIEKELYLLTGAGPRSRTISIKAVSEVLGEDLCKCLLGFHAFTGCDCTSAFSGKVKVKPWKVLSENPEFVETFSSLGTSFEVCEDVFNSLQRFVCLLYGDKKGTCVDDSRYIIFASGKCYDECLPPNKDSLLLHTERANYQACVWNRCLLPRMRLQPPGGNGWHLKDGQLEVLWMNRPSAPDTLIECVSCNCKTGCKSLRCSCLKSGLKCSDICGCTHCCNIVLEDILSEEENDDNSDDSDSEGIDDYESNSDDESS